MSSIKALKKKIAKRAKQKKNIQVKNSIRLKQAKPEQTEQTATAVEAEMTATAADSTTAANP